MPERPEIQNAVRARSKRAGLAGLDLTTHPMLHGLAVDLQEGGADIRTVQEVLGHRSNMTTW